MSDARETPGGPGAPSAATPRPERFAVRRPVTVAMAFLAMAVFGWQSFIKIPRNLMPDITYPTLTVRTELEGAAPEEIEDLVSKPLEEALGTANNLVEVSSVSSAGLSEVILEFTWNTNMDFAVLDLRGKLDRVVLPKEAKRPIILRYNPNLDPVLRVAVFGAADLFELREVADDEIKRELEGITGVASAQVDGGLEEEIAVNIEEARAARLGISVESIAQRLAQENINLAGGQLKEGKVEYLVRTRNEFQDPAEMESIVVGGDPRSGTIRLRDVAEVARSHRERKTITRIGGEEAVLLSIFKEADANTVTVVRSVRERLAAMFAGPRAAGAAAPEAKGGKDAKLVRARDLSANIPSGMGYRTISDQAKFIESALNEVQSNALMGGILALLILMVFLRDARSTLIIGLSIPISIAITFVPMFAFGISLNVMSLGGLALGVGMLVDNG
ncbi:MAG: efflux RND transporter permease subunit, partial [Myxococcales bacterium]|nr:efflux RND transporter permease subunit [Myxococcales bacterium]